jgi:hypothetical protein
MVRFIFREVTDRLDTVEGALTGSLFAKQDTELVLETEDGPYPVSLSSGELLRLENVRLYRIQIRQGRVLVSAIEHRPNSRPPLAAIVSASVIVSSAPSLEARLDSILGDLQQVTTNDNLKAKPVALYSYDYSTGSFVPIRSDMYGRLFIFTVDRFTSFAFGQYEAYVSLSATNNTSGISLVSIYSHPRVSYWVRCGGACDINVYVSRDNASWRLVKSTSLPSAGEYLDYFETAYKHVKVEVPTTNIDVEIEIARNR